MGNPFLVIMAIVVAAVTAAFGIPQITGAIDDANDGASVQDLGQIAIVQEAAYTKGANYATKAQLEAGQVDDGGTGAQTEIGMKFQQSGGTHVAVVADNANNRWAAISTSRSGKVFVRTSESTDVYETANKVTTIQRSQFSGLPSWVTVGGNLTAPTIGVTP